MTIIPNQSDQMAKRRMVGVVNEACPLRGASATWTALPLAIAPMASAMNPKKIGRAHV